MTTGKRFRTTLRLARVAMISAQLGAQSATAMADAGTARVIVSPRRAPIPTSSRRPLQELCTGSRPAVEPASYLSGKGAGRFS